MAEFNISGIPDDLPPGKYSTRVVRAYWFVDRDDDTTTMFELEYVGPYNEDNPCLLPFTKDAPKPDLSLPHPNSDLDNPDGP